VQARSSRMGVMDRRCESQLQIAIALLLSTVRRFETSW
jgi:hypothetical protein